MNKKRNIVISGATGDIGQAIVHELSDENLILIARNDTKVDNLTNDLVPKSNVNMFHANLDNHEEVVNACACILSKYKKIDWVIHSAGYISEKDSFEKFDLNLFNRMFSINTLAVMTITSSLLNRIDNNGGSIVISSTAGLNGNGKVPAYAMSKGALNTFSKSLALYWQDTNKRSISICPGPTNTRMREKFAQDAAKHQSPTFISKLIKQIISEPNRFTNGTILSATKGTIKVISN